ncbi:MAG: enterotoxin, partial [Lentisphaeraceae bacterium]|nr:enterotoxin [Lentisphaeraceae bacterium]
NPDIFLNTTLGSWESAVWFNHIDCTWRGRQDMGFIGKGPNNREKWLNYRDGISYNAIARSAFLYPLNALMNHGIVFANGHKFPSKANMGEGWDDLRNEVRSYFGGGYALQELYLTPDMLKGKHWATIADAAKWAKSREHILVDSHFIGGNPNKGEVYGFAAWQKGRGTITLRNPNDVEQKFELNLKDIFELYSKKISLYKIKSPYKDQRIQSFRLKSNKTKTITLKPFEVLVFDAITSK